MINVGEQIVSSYLKYVRGCEFIQTNLYTVETQGEIDVVGIDLESRKLYVCEVAIHLSTGLQYTKDKRPNNVNKLSEKLARDIEYARKYFKDYDAEFMLWSPIVKLRKDNPVYNQVGHLESVAKSILTSHSVEVTFVINEKFQKCLKEMRSFAAKQSSELKCPIMRLFQVEEQLKRHVGAEA